LSIGDFSPSGKTVEPDIPILKEAKAEYPTAIAGFACTSFSWRNQAISRFDRWSMSDMGILRQSSERRHDYNLYL
jgi:hypothetical protein